MDLRAVFLVVLVALLHSGGSEGVRLCGRKLADMLNTICRKNGGFHAPRRDVEVRSEEDDSIRSGIVEECCRRQCNLTTLASYCADPSQVTELDIEGLLPGTTSPFSLKDFAKYQHLRTQFQTNSGSSSPRFSRPKSSSHPNLGQFMRNRPVFMVLTEAHQSDEDSSFGDHRF